MFRFKKYIGLAALVAIVAALGISSLAAAQGTTTPTPTAPTAPAAPRGGFGFGFRLHSQAALDAAAKALGMTSDELSAQLWGGKTLADLASAKGVDIATVKKAVDAALVAETKTAIQQAVKDGNMTQAKADWLIQGLDNGYWGPGQGGPGFDMGPGGPMMGPGFGGPHGFGGLNGAAPNSAAPNNSGTTTPSRFSF